MTNRALRIKDLCSGNYLQVATYFFARINSFSKQWNCRSFETPWRSWSCNVDAMSWTTLAHARWVHINVYIHNIHGFSVYIFVYSMTTIFPFWILKKCFATFSYRYVTLMKSFVVIHAFGYTAAEQWCQLRTSMYLIYRRWWTIMKPTTKVNTTARNIGVRHST